MGPAEIATRKVQAIEALNLRGIYFQEENQRYYPKRDMASHVLGFVDVDDKGLGGIEHEYDSLIRSKGEKIVVMADARQRWFDGGEAQADRGANVILTIDEKIQYIAERNWRQRLRSTAHRREPSLCKTRTPARFSPGELAKI